MNAELEVVVQVAVVSLVTVPLELLPHGSERDEAFPPETLPVPGTIPTLRQAASQPHLHTPHPPAPREPIEAAWAQAACDSEKDLG